MIFDNTILPNVLFRISQGIDNDIVFHVAKPCIGAPLFFTHGTFICVPMGNFEIFPLYVPWFIRLRRECGKSGNFARVP